MTTGSVLGVLSILIVAAAPNLPVFLAGWMRAGFAMMATFYQPAFAAITRWWVPDHVRALTIVTLAGGLASTFFAPLTAVLADRLSWRMTYAVLALILAAVTIPAHALALKAPWPAAPPPSTPHAGEAAMTATHSRPSWMLAAALTLSAFTVSAVVVALVPLLLERGYSTSEAAWALGLGGAGQTSRPHVVRNSRPTRRGYRPHDHTDSAWRHHHRRLALVPGPYAFVIVLSVVAGMVRGNLTLLQATAITDRWGTSRYGRLSGLLAARPPPPQPSPHSQVPRWRFHWAVTRSCSEYWQPSRCLPP